MSFIPACDWKDLGDSNISCPRCRIDVIGLGCNLFILVECRELEPLRATVPFWVFTQNLGDFGNTRNMVSELKNVGIGVVANHPLIDSKRNLESICS
jgi:hypothetical protein